MTVVITGLPVIACVAAADLEPLRDALASEGFRVLALDGSGATDRASLVAAIVRDLPCAGMKVTGWDGVADALWNGLAGLAPETERVAILWSHADALLAGGLTELATAAIVFSNLASQVASTAAGFPRALELRVFLAGEGPNFPRLRRVAAA